MSDQQQTDTLDPHGFHRGGGHGHTIVSPWTLLAVLVSLLVLTGLTVAARQTELWMIESLDISLPHWLNIAVALSIGLAKATLVVLFFMQLKYDSPLNAILVCFSLLAMALFLGITMMDLGNRDTVDPIKAGQIVAGGTGNVSRKADTWDFELQRRVPEYDPETGERVIETVTGPITAFSRAKWMKIWGEREFHRRELLAHGGHPGRKASDENKSRPAHGRTEGLFDEAGHVPNHD